jgi:ribonucleoside-diphosphate reductase alpha chain
MAHLTPNLSLTNHLPTLFMSQSAPSIYWLNKDSRTFLSRDYLLPGVTPEARIREIAESAEKILGFEGFADKFEKYMHLGWFSLSSPIWSNFGADRGLPISCNGSFIPDSMSGILEKTAEIGMMTKHGAGTSGYFGDLRARGSDIKNSGKSSGPVHFMELFDKLMNVVSQGSVRRGSFAAYLPVEHPDIMEFLQIRDEGNPIQNLSIGVTITDYWMNAMTGGDKDKRKVWARIVQKRFESGYPYVFFTDTVNRGKPQVYKDKGMDIHASNLCSEICLPSSDAESFVCDLSSMNLLHWDEWKSTDAAEVLTYFLDAVMSDYITKTKDVPFMAAAHHFSVNHRALGVGVLGWHSYLQSKSIAFESMEAKLLNTQIHRLIRDKALVASKRMAKELGEPPLLKGYGLRNTTLMAIAPTTSSSFILGQVSPSIEPLNSNYFVKGLAKGKFTYRNPYLEKVLETYSKNDQKTWEDILVHGGSVQHLTFLTDHEKDVFKTFGEISPKEIIIQAAARQKFIDQSQSLNLMIPTETPPKDASQLLIDAWKMGVKTIYYQRGSNPAQQLARDILTCKSCEA